MNTTTLRGVFPDPKPVYKKNYIKENMKHIKRMQGVLQESGAIHKKSSKDDDKYRNIPPQTSSQFTAPVTRSKPNLMKRMSQTGSLPIPTKPTNQFKIKRQKPGNLKLTAGDNTLETTKETEEKITNRAIQTVLGDDIDKLYEDGIIMYPSPSVVKALSNRKMSSRRKSFSQENSSNLDSNSEQLTDKMQNLVMNDKKNVKLEMNDDLYQLPPTYQKGVVPKYLRQRKEEQTKEIEGDTECPPGHVLLPEDERKETLRVLRESYAERIQELNSMPVRNDTLKMRKRKIALEEELKKIDEGIKVFQRPKVFVKVNA